MEKTASLPSSATKEPPVITLEYLVPNWNVWAASTERTRSTSWPHRGQASPVSTWAKEPHSSTVKSRPSRAPLTWWSARLAPVIQGPGRDFTVDEWGSFAQVETG